MLEGLDGQGLEEKRLVEYQLQKTYTNSQVTLCLMDQVCIRIFQSNSYSYKFSISQKKVKRMTNKSLKPLQIVLIGLVFQQARQEPMSSQLIFFQGNDLKSAFQWSRHLSQNQSDNMDVSFTPCVYDWRLSWG